MIVENGQPTLGVTIGNPIAREAVEPYTGEYTVTPSTSPITLLTEGLKMVDNLVIQGYPRPPIVTGTFTTPSTYGIPVLINLDYSGHGYPIAAFVYIADGIYSFNGVAQWAVGQYAMVKADLKTRPTYSATGAASVNHGAVTILYKNSSTTANSYATLGNTTSSSVSTYAPPDSTAGFGLRCILFTSNNRMQYITRHNTAQNSYGLMQNKKYAYIIIYSE